MTEITEYEHRITAALSRIDRGIDTLQASRAAETGLSRSETEALSLQITALEEALDHERAAVARLAGELADRDAALDAAAAGEQASGGTLVDFAPVSHPSFEAQRIAALEADLAAERDSNAQLVERVRAIREKQEQSVGALERRVAKLSDSLETGGTDIAKLRRVNGQLRESNIALREALARGLPDATLINRGLEVELEALRAARASEAAEMDDILAELRPMLTEAARA